MSETRKIHPNSRESLKKIRPKIYSQRLLILVFIHQYFRVNKAYPTTAQVFDFVQDNEARIPRAKRSLKRLNTCHVRAHELYHDLHYIRPVSEVASSEGHQWIVTVEGWRKLKQEFGFTGMDSYSNPALTEVS